MKTMHAFVVAAILPAAVRAAQPGVAVDFDRETGRIRPELHSAGFGPQICSCPQLAIDEIKAMGFKASRTHDWALINPNQRVCDWFHIFPLANLDAKDPANYVFGPTDYLLKRTREELGHDVFFRLGTSIEHSGQKVHFNSLIPGDFEKVAETFAGTVRHYNRGWADGHEWGIKYWEIWNEPDGMNNMWCLPDGDAGRGPTPEARSADQLAREKKRLDLFARFFATCLKRLKDEFGDTVKVGGPALCSWRATRKDRIGTADYFRRMFEECKKVGVAPDFVSWHYYGSKPADVLAAVDRLRKLCDEYGFTGCELVLNEWHYLDVPWGTLRSTSPEVRRRVWSGPAAHNGIDSSCFNLALLSRFQTSKLDLAFYYGCKNTGAWGFKDEFGVKYKVWYGLKMFGDFIKEMPVMCESKADGGVTVLAAKGADGSKRGFIVTDYRSGADEISVGVSGVAPDAEGVALVHDETEDLKQIKVRLSGGRLVLKKSGRGSAAFCVKF